MSRFSILLIMCIEALESIERLLQIQILVSIRNFVLWVNSTNFSKFFGAFPCPAWISLCSRRDLNKFLAVSAESLCAPALRSLRLNHVHVRKPRSKKIVDNFPWDIVVFDECSNACFPPRRAPCVDGREVQAKLIPAAISAAAWITSSTQKNGKRATDKQKAGQRSAWLQRLMIQELAKINSPENNV